MAKEGLGGAKGLLSRQTDYRETTISKMVAAGETSPALLPWVPRLPWQQVTLACILPLIQTEVHPTFPWASAA